MNKIKTYNILWIALGILFLGSCVDKDQNKSSDSNIVIMLSLDGFRWDYPDMYDTPNLDKIAQQGVKADAIIPCFPTKTFPNHYSMATGLYPDNHGLVNNTYYDPQREDIYRIGDRSKVEDGYYYGGEPIWVTAEKQGIKSASFFWVGSEAEINGYRPSIWKRFDSSVPYTDRMDSVISWTQLPTDIRPGLITWYIEEPDGIGHNFGPASSEMDNMIEKLDSIVGVFINRIQRLPNSDKINIIITSDHGMGETKGGKYINITENLKEHWTERILGYNPVIFIDPVEKYSDSVEITLNSIEHVSLWDRNEVPSHLNYGKNDRISSLIITADSGWSIGTKENANFDIGGAHGYDFTNSDMHAIFYAMGPDFNTNYSHKSFYNIDIYPLICEILGLEPEAVDGKLSRVELMLKD